MKRKLLLFCALTTFVVVSACQNGQPSSEAPKNKVPARVNNFVGGGSTAGAFIPKDSANKMIQSYLTSISSGGGDSLLKSLSFDADSLRAYLIGNPSVKHVKIMLAHTLEYINAEGAGHNVGYESGALTVVFGGYDANYNYVYWQGNNVLDHGNPCPASCPISGTASNDLFP